MWLFVPFVLVPLIEIALFIQVGGLIGLWPTLAIVVLTALLGTSLVRQQGVRAVQELRGSISALRDPTEPLAHGAMILIAGALLLTPGFFTDAVGFALLIPPVRSAAYRWLRKRIKVERFSYGDAQYDPRPSRPDVIDGDYYEVGEKPGGRSSSGWTRH